MLRRQFVPDEKRSLRGIFFISSMVLVGTTVWALWDESVSRRPWIRYQTAFKQLEYQTVQRELEEASARLNQPEVQTRLEKLREELRWAEEARRGPDYQAAVKEVEGRKAAYDAINQELRFTRSELDEAYYWYDKAKHEGKDATAQLAEVNRLKELEAMRTRPLEVKQVVLDGLDKNEFDVFVLRVDRCETCHLGIDRPGFENAPPPFRTHPNREAILGKHPVSRFGCTVCHEGQGTALDFEWRVEGRIPDTPHGLGREYGGSPNILWDFPLLRGEMVESSCRKCHLDRTEFTAAIKTGEGQGTKVEWMDLAPTLTKGLGMFEILGCYGCHPVEGYKEAAKVGPELIRIANKVEPGWLIQWIQNPQSYLSHTRMPNFGLSKEQATAIAAYLLARSEPDPPVAGRYNPGASPEGGKQIFERVGCLGCHAMRAVYEEKEPRSLFKMVGRDHAPDLSNVAAKIKDPQWLFRWLKNPKANRPQTPP